MYTRNSKKSSFDRKLKFIYKTSNYFPERIKNSTLSSNVDHVSASFELPTTFAYQKKSYHTS